MSAITIEMIDSTTAAVSEFWDNGMAKQPDYIAQLFNVKDTDLSQENFLGIGAIGNMSPWAGTVNYQQFTKGFSKGFAQAKYSSGLQFDERVFRYREYSQLEEKTGLLLDSVYNTLQTHGGWIFDNAFDATFAGPDAVALCSASHPYSPSDSTVQINAGTLELTIPDLIATYKLMSKFTDDQGNRLNVYPDILMTGIEYWDVGKKICGPSANEKEPFMADNDPNIMKKELTYMFNPYVSGKKWFLLNRTRMKRRLKWFFGRHPKPEHVADFDTEAIKYKIVGEWVNGWTSWEFCYGQNAD